MRKILATLAAFLVCTLASAEVTIKDGRFYLNGERKETLWGRTCFKLGNHVTYHYTGQGGGIYGLHSAEAWVDHQLSTFGEDSVCRVLLENTEWSNCEAGWVDDGKPDNCMFGSEPRDQGFWDVPRLRAEHRPMEVHPVGRQVLEWFYETSQRKRIVFELVIIATLKHAQPEIEIGKQSHVIRQVAALAYELQEKYPRANIILSAINEWNAHSKWDLHSVNQLAQRVDRWKNMETGATTLSFTSPGPAWEREQCPGCVFIVDGGGGNTFDFDVGPEPGKFRLGAVHPVRDHNWYLFPNAAQKAQLVQDSRGMPWGFPESMYYVEPEDEERAKGWYRRDGWTTNWGLYEQFLIHVESQGIPYFIVHDEKGAQTNPAWPRVETRVDRWAREKFKPGPTPPPQPKVVRYDHLIDTAYMLVLKRPADPVGLDVYNNWLRSCYADSTRNCWGVLVDTLSRSQEYRDKFER